MTSDRNRLAYLDSMRGLAALFVSQVHYLMLVKEHQWYASFEQPILFVFTEIFDLGKIGVLLFFMVSGFVIPPTLSGPLRSGMTRFWISRFFRLYPIYWVSIPLGIVAFWMIPGRELGMEVVALNITMLQQFFMAPNIIGLYWTLQIELVFYALCSVLFVTGLLHRGEVRFYAAMGFLAIAVAMASARGIFMVKLPVALPAALSIMFFGSLWRDHLERPSPEGESYLGYYLLCYAAAIPVISVLAYSRDMGWGETWYRYQISYFSALVLFYVFTTVARINHSAFCYLGKISYSYYLLHSPIIAVVSFYFGDRFFNMSGSGLLYCTLIIALSLALSSITYKYVELPFIAMGRRIYAKWQSKQGSALGA